MTLTSMAAIDSTDWSAKTYSDPRMRAEIPGWPIGRDQRATAVFVVEQHPKRGERVARVIVGKPLKTSYARKARIVTGDDGRTYIAELTEFGSISIMRGDMKYSHDGAMKRDPRHTELLRLFAD